MNREIDRLIVKHVLKLPMAQTSESYIDGWLDGQNFYSTHLADALKIAETFDSWQLTKMGTIGQHSGQYRAFLGATKNCAYDKSAPLAICRAALISAGITV